MFNKLYTKSKKDNEIDNNEYTGLFKRYEVYKNNKKNKLSFFKLKIILFSDINIFCNKDISTNISGLFKSKLIVIINVNANVNVNKNVNIMLIYLSFSLFT